LPSELQKTAILVPRRRNGAAMSTLSGAAKAASANCVRQNRSARNGAAISDSRRATISGLVKGRRSRSPSPQKCCQASCRSMSRSGLSAT
jgi:hypothetical protein